MKLVNNDYQIDISLNENEVNVLVLENHDIFTNIVQSMWFQCNGELGTWILLQDEKLLNMSKNIKCIINPFSINLNEKTIISKLYQELKCLSDENLAIESANVNMNIINYIEKLLFMTPYPLTYKPENNVIDLFKIYDIKIYSIADTFLEKLVEYIKIMTQICHIHIFVFIGLKQYLSEKDIRKLYEFVFYEKINLLLIENHQSKKSDDENVFIIDNDLCIIKLDDN